MHFPWQAQYKRHVHFRRSGHSFISFAGLGLGFLARRPSGQLAATLSGWLGFLARRPPACFLTGWLYVSLLSLGFSQHGG